MEDFTEEQREVITALGLKVDESGLVVFDEDGDVTYIVEIDLGNE